MPDLRMPDLNKVCLAGRLTREPELRYTPQGVAVCKLGLAVSRIYKGRDGERKEDTCFVDVTVWEKMAEYIGQRLHQGAPVLVEGRLKSDSWEDKSTGQKRSKLEIVAVRVQELAWSTDRQPGASAPSAPAPSQARERISQDEPIPEDDIPF
jgi:single-strand DNA-binding protein